jgi:hypothetical protein
MINVSNSMVSSSFSSFITMIKTPSFNNFFSLLSLLFHSCSFQGMKVEIVSKVLHQKFSLQKKFLQLFFKIFAMNNVSKASINDIKNSTKKYTIFFVKLRSISMHGYLHCVGVWSKLWTLDQKTHSNLSSKGNCF